MASADIRPLAPWHLFPEVSSLATYNYKINIFVSVQKSYTQKPTECDIELDHALTN